MDKIVETKEMPIFFKRTRLAPTPSGYLHLGNIFSFAVTADLARRSGAKIMLRIDDMDRDRADPLYVQDIFDTLDFMEIPWDEGPKNALEFEQEYSQVHRMDLYQEALWQLKDNGNVFACTCSRAQLLRAGMDGVHPGTCRDKDLPLDLEGVSWRLHTQGSSLPPSMQDFVVRKKDGAPAYQLTSLIDDLHYGVDLVVRGEDLRPSTLAQQYLASVLRKETFRKITFHHHPLLMVSPDEKLSKSAGATSIQYLRKQGRKPAEIYALIAGTLGKEGPAGSWQELAALAEKA